MTSICQRLLLIQHKMCSCKLCFWYFCALVKKSKEHFGNTSDLNGTIVLDTDDWK